MKYSRHTLVPNTSASRQTPDWFAPRESAHHSVEYRSSLVLSCSGVVGRTPGGVEEQGRPRNGRRHS